ncbi:hypothetical protein ACFL1A_03395 [Patescibacteria group bacterium]
MNILQATKKGHDKIQNRRKILLLWAVASIVNIVIAGLTAAFVQGGFLLPLALAIILPSAIWKNNNSAALFFALINILILIGAAMI